GVGVVTARGARVPRRADARAFLHVRARDYDILIYDRWRGEAERRVGEPIERARLHVHDALVAEAGNRLTRFRVQRVELSRRCTEKQSCGRVFVARPALEAARRRAAV